ncbi:MAG: YraN family protein [Hyphomicrobiales bacterium]|nr:YraN family protein [Hyphomicrobiales bacterium]
MDAPDRRRAAHRFGLGAERIAGLWLTLKGYRVIDRRVRLADGEIDLVATRGDTIAFVEVKARATLEEAMEAITPRKRRRISRAAAAWLARHPASAGMTGRGDAVFLAPWRRPRHVAAAFELELG